VSRMMQTSCILPIVFIYCKKKKISLKAVQVEDIADSVVFKLLNTSYNLSRAFKDRLP
jgi:hypothetical protein